MKAWAVMRKRDGIWKICFNRFGEALIFRWKKSADDYVEYSNGLRVREVEIK